MPVFAVEAIDRAGKRVRKEMDAVSKDEAIKKVRSQGLRPTKIAEKKAPAKTSRPKQKTPTEGITTIFGGATTPAGRSVSAEAAPAPSWFLTAFSRSSAADRGSIRTNRGDPPTDAWTSGEGVPRDNISAVLSRPVRSTISSPPR